MQRERQGRDDFFAMGDPFGNFRGFGMMPSLFGGRDPFDDPFFTRPFGSMFESSRFNPPSATSREELQTDRAKALVIEELASDDEGEKEDDQTGEEKSDHQKHIGSSQEPTVEHPDDYPDERENNAVNYRSDFKRTEGTKPQIRSSSFQTCKVTYGGIDGAYYTSTRNRRTGSDGVVIEESKEADKTTGQATHRISRGINDKGHSVARKLNQDGKVDTKQTLHNLNEGRLMLLDFPDDLTGFEEAWKGKGQLPAGWSDHFDMYGTRALRIPNCLSCQLSRESKLGTFHIEAGMNDEKLFTKLACSRGCDQKGVGAWGGWALPSTRQAWSAGGMGSESKPGTNASGGRAKNVANFQAVVSAVEDNYNIVLGDMKLIWLDPKDLIPKEHGFTESKLKNNANLSSGNPRILSRSVLVVGDLRARGHPSAYLILLVVIRIHKTKTSGIIPCPPDQ
ncbi:unnamed protein product [Dovyalis caffra]|uniref:Uncharacterized protein n=1 Tax=Dovyalis caffra TaxID=77055 RepID=A0AAV1S914_9ROSI|nr:unnamed protein product [Dovyalis caffra]